MEVLKKITFGTMSTKKRSNSSEGGNRTPGYRGSFVAEAAIVKDGDVNHYTTSDLVEIL